ncbi:uncharacterized protein LOC124156127 [Ischnura elegans]|uniref:uncharacterized protein LOC124156127 n=1 Tax=Ischnura elegans TaxID=197161 RepID=UPI001ED87D2D|nr:uncharacterized protein LOC124156127 [Ischnura elegans]
MVMLNAHFILLVFSTSQILISKVNGVYFNSKRCKLTISGYEYAGTLGRSASGFKCKSWAKAAEKIADEKFIDGSRKLAHSFCRNPNNDPRGPWCYTSNGDGKVDYCDIPLCHITDCKVTIAGSEYGGALSKSVSGLECHPWKLENSGEGQGETFSEVNFPGGSLGPEGRSCRNPNGNVGGPWCWVKPSAEALENEEGFADKEDSNLVAELCDVPFCDEPGCLVFVSGPRQFSRFLSITKLTKNLTFSFKPMLMDSWKPKKTGHFASLFLSIFSSPYSSGFEVKLPLYGYGLMELKYIKSGEIREGTHLTMGAEENGGNYYIMDKITGWNGYQIAWSDGNLAVYKLKLNNGNVMQSDLHLLYDPKESESSPEVQEDLNNLGFISLSGDPSLWSTNCDESHCPVHTIIESRRSQWKRLRLDATGTHLKFNARGFGSVGIEFSPSPIGTGPTIKIVIGEKNQTIVSYRMRNSSDHDAPYKIVMKSSVETEVTFWEWKDFTISFFGDRIEVYSSLKEASIDQMETILVTSHSSARLMRWFSPFSPKGTVSHWTFYCLPEEEDKAPEALPPECITSMNPMVTKKYMGSHSVSKSGMPCLPWIDPTMVERLATFEHSFPDPSPKLAGVSCRNPTGGPLGPWCYRLLKDNVDESGRAKIKGEECGVRKCRYEDCRMSGIGTDYIGNLNKTISGRTCQRWDSSSPHMVTKALQNSSLFADLDIKKANNYCRNPSRNNAGPWCYTVDNSTPMDVCDIRDCVRPETCTVLVRGVGEGRLLYILPYWKTQGLSIWLKEWDPDHTDGLVFILRPIDEMRYYKLVIGADGNQRVKLFYKNETGEYLMKEKTVHYVVPAGRWGGFNLKLGHGWIVLSYEGASLQRLFDWTHFYDEESDNPTDAPFTPLFLTFTSYLGHTIGLHFHCSECHVEKTSTSRFTKLLPIRRPLNSTSTKSTNSTRLEFLLRGNGIALIPLMRQPGMGDYYGVTIGERDGHTSFLIRKLPKAKVKVLARASQSEKLLFMDKWTHFTISFNETNLQLYREEQEMIHFQSNETLLFYWYSLGTENGNITWATNCEPPDIDGDPRDGGWSSWSSWQCSATCGGGVGRRERRCNNPTPNVYGKGCEGQPLHEGSCNRYPCGAVSPSTVSRIRDNLREKYSGTVAEEGKTVILPCGNFTGRELLNATMKESPNSSIAWAKDGSRLVDRDGLTIFDNYDLELKNVTTADSGVYLCVIWQVIEEKKEEVAKKKVKGLKKLKEKTKTFFSRLQGKVKNKLPDDNDLRSLKPLTLSVASVAVTRAHQDHRPTMSIRETRKVRMQCRALALSLVYADLQLEWYLNGSLWKDYGFVSPDVISEEILVVGREHHGVWTCVASQPDLRLSWTTNWILLEVKPPPNFFSMLMEDGLTAPIFRPLGSETAVIIAFFVMLALIFIIICTTKFITIRYFNNQKQE